MPTSPAQLEQLDRRKTLRLRFDFFILIHSGTIHHTFLPSIPLHQHVALNGGTPHRADNLITEGSPI
ncbi:MAG TPA: hypothetical protein VMN36_18945 [Verrucomicrobiales bacterium]|nr:hypothetical protein [Verrucomicrobiales bacterium]